MRFVTFLSVAAVGALLTLEAAAADVTLYAFIKTAIFAQTNSGTPVPVATNGFTFDALVFAATNDVVTNATFLGPNTSTQTIPALTNNIARLFEQTFNTSNDMELVYPTGTSLFALPTYSMTMYTVDDGTPTGSMSFGIPFRLGTYPAVPQFSNFSAAQAVDTTASFQLQWTLAGASSNYTVQVIVNDAVTNVFFSSPAPGTSNALTGLSNSVVIPANILPPGTNLTARLQVISPVGGDTNSYPGVIGAAALSTQVQFPMLTRPAPAHPQLSILSGKNLPFQLQFTGETNRNYHIQSSSNFAGWTDLLVTNPVAVTGSYTDASSPNKGAQFYRIQVGP